MAEKSHSRVLSTRGRSRGRAIGVLALASASLISMTVSTGFGQTDATAPSVTDVPAPVPSPAPAPATDTTAPTVAPTPAPVPDTTAPVVTPPAPAPDTTAPVVAPVTPSPAPDRIPIDDQATWPAGNAEYVVYRQTPQPLGDHDGVVLWVRGDGTAMNLRVRLMTMDATTTSPDTAMLRPMWISSPILVKSTTWKQVRLPRSKFTLHRLDGAPDGIDPSLPADAQGGTVPAADPPKFADVNTIALESNVPWNSTIAVDDLAFANFDASGAVTDTAPIDNFETGNVAAWTAVGDPDSLKLLTYGIITKPTWAHQGRIAFKINVISPAASRKSLAMPGALRAMASTHKSYLVFTPPSTFAKILPSSLPPPGGTSSLVDVQLCPEQTQAASFCLYSKKAMPNVAITLIDDLHGIGHILSKKNVDLEVVKVWNQLGNGILRDPDTAGPVPELLVKDDRIPLSGDAPTVRLTGDPVTDIPADTTKQFWITVTAPRGTAPDTYSGRIMVSAVGTTPFTVPLTVKVLALRLMSPAKQYAIDLRSRIDTPPSTLPAHDGSAFVTDYVSADLLSKQLADIAAHGVRYVSIHDSDATLWDAYNARKTAGFIAPFVYKGADDPNQIEAERQTHHADGFIYYSDPSSGSKLADMTKKGLPTATYIAHPADFDSLQNSLDTVIYDEDEDYPQQLIRTHGRRMSMKHDWWYWDASSEDPRTNRYSSGYLLQRSMLYGAFLPQYQLAFGTDPYDEMSAGAPDVDQQYRPEMLTYPAADGVIDTIQWEAVREGINDERYLTTMYAALRECKDAHIVKPLVDEALGYVNAFLDKPLALLSDSDYDDARAKISDYAFRLRTAVDTYNKQHGL